MRFFLIFQVVLNNTVWKEIFIFSYMTIIHSKYNKYQVILFIYCFCYYMQHFFYFNYFLKCYYIHNEKISFHEFIFFQRLPCKNFFIKIHHRIKSSEIFCFYFFFFDAPVKYRISFMNPHPFWEYVIKIHSFKIKCIRLFFAWIFCFLFFFYKIMLSEEEPR